MGFQYGRLLWEWQQAQAWMEAPCVLKKPGLPALAEELEAQYRYTYAGESYEGALVALDPGSDPSADYEERLLPVLAAALQRGGDFRYFVNPALPGQAVLFRKPRAAELLVLSLLCFSLAIRSCGGRFWPCIALRSQHPGAPWFWRPEWVGGVIPPDNHPFPGYDGRQVRWRFS